MSCRIWLMSLSWAQSSQVLSTSYDVLIGGSTQVAQQELKWTALLRRRWTCTGAGWWYPVRILFDPDLLKFKAVFLSTVRELAGMHAPIYGCVHTYIIAVYIYMHIHVCKHRTKVPSRDAGHWVGSHSICFWFLAYLQGFCITLG